MLPRHYQEEVLRYAQQGNIIAVLDTGSGKTFISLLLLKWLVFTRPGAKAIFLVPKVALVEQQGQFIASHSALRVKKLSGSLDIDLADRNKWTTMFEFHDVFVMTPQIFLNLIAHSLWSIDKASGLALMIFDECHHTRKNHPYNIIMREYSAVSPTSRPKIFGMTASPVWNVKDVSGSLAALETNMNSKLMAVRDHVDELSLHTPKVTEVIKQYSSPPLEYAFPSPTLGECMSIFKTIFNDLNISWDEMERRYMTTHLDLGPHCASLYLYREISHRLVQLPKDIIGGEADGCVTKDLNSERTHYSKQLSTEVAQIEEILVAYEHLSAPLPVPLEWCSPKIGALVEILLSHASSTFQGIIFVEQRQTAVCLARVLSSIPALNGAIQCAELLGQGDGTDGVWKSEGHSAKNTVRAFRERRINLIVATAVAEEGLDFPTCDLVIRFDALQHMIGYVQSRGRARGKASTFVIMVEENNATHLARYQAFVEKDPELKAIYQARQDPEDGNTAKLDDDAEEEDIDPTDLAQRERYVVASTGATLTYDNAINLLHRFCALIPRDAYTAAHLPQFSGEFHVTVLLPSALPLPRQELRFEGPLKCSKKEAKRAVAFKAVKRLHGLDLFDQYLLPVLTTPQGHEDNDQMPLSDVSDVPNMMRISVKDPWTTEWFDKLWIHPIFIGGKRVAGLVTGTRLFPVEFQKDGQALVQTGTGEHVEFNSGGSPHEECELMHQFTKRCIWYRITGSPLDLPLTFYIVPNADTGQPDYTAIRRLLSCPGGNSNWDSIDESQCGYLMVANVNLTGHFYVLQRIRHDLSPASVPPADSQEAGFASYRDYWVDKWSGKPGSRKRPPLIPESGPLLELSPFPRLKPSGACSGSSLDADSQPSAGATHVLFPQGCCRWIEISEDVREALHILPTLHGKLTSIYRARLARQCLSLPPVLDNVLIEALTLPCAFAEFSNQRLETLGDAVLQLCTTVNLFNRHPNMHEGQLSGMRQNSVSNHFLLCRAKEVGLEAFLTCETQDIKTWRGNIQCARVENSSRCALREFPRRSLQDCMEATLGASFVTGGIEMSLLTGRVLGLDFGGPLPWCVRYSIVEESPVSSTFSVLEELLGYSFRSGILLMEALTHPSFDNQTTNSYQRLEFLGDAVLDLVVVDYLYRKFPDATSDQLAWPRTRAICASALAAIGVGCLQLHQLMLINNVELSKEIERYVPLLQACSGEEIVQRGWQYDPPKALSDVFESVVGAVLVDSNYNYERTAAVVEFVMQDVLAALTPSLPRDPISELLQFVASTGCESITGKHILKSTEQNGTIGVTVIVHGVTVAGPIFSTSASVAKNLAAERAQTALKDGTNENHLPKICDCRSQTKANSV
ncbi:hypothetical protein GGX14DRAFT_670866 [Mycena pura]|uniref:Dicer-like protein 1 n=1 Tax=Mycena pura TaxID=153505 RepID=A0AAD6VV87_9AGAR|nr:hypothetical protein GGX14DRAFT_670866 [Mycena pura]